MRYALFALALTVSTSAVAEDSPDSGEAAQTATPAAEAPEEKVICKRVAASESRMAAKKVCMTAKQWKRAASNER